MHVFCIHAGNAWKVVAMKRSYIKYFYLAIAVLAFMVALSGSIAGSLGWNAKTLSYQIGSQVWGVVAGLTISLTALLVASSLPESYRQKKQSLFYISAVALVCLIAADGWLSYEANDITDELALNGAVSVVESNENAELALLYRNAQLALTDAERVLKVLNETSPDKPAYKRPYWEAKAKADSLQLVYQAAKDTLLTTAKSERKERPITKVIGAWALILSYTIGGPVARVYFDRYRMLDKEDREAAKDYKVEKAVDEPDIDYTDLKQVSPYFSSLLRSGELTREMVRIAREQGNQTFQWQNNWFRKIDEMLDKRPTKRPTKRTTKSRLFAVLSANGKNGHANSITS